MSFKNLSVDELERHIRSTALQAKEIRWTAHAKQRIRERDVQVDDVVECLRKGRICMPPEEDLRTGHLICRMQWYCVGDEVAVCVALDDCSSRLTVVTVILS